MLLNKKQSSPMSPKTTIGVLRTIFNFQSSIRNKGFTFFEVMVTVAVLSFGIVMIFQAFLTSLNAFSYYLTHLQVQNWADEKIWEISDRLIRKDTLEDAEMSGELVIANKNITWNIDVIPLDFKREFFKLSLLFSWDEGKRKIQLRREAYAGM